MNQKSLDKKKTSEIFEGVNSTLYQAFIGAVERDKNKTKELDWELTQEQKGWLLDVLNTDSDNALKVILINGLISKLITQQITELLEEINKEIDYSEVHHEVVLENWGEESRDVFKSKSEVKGFLMALEAFRELITKLLNKKDE